ncbi:acyltransferase family protein [Kocuria coralli]|nr:acyltransferase [Kocuria coralli]
MSQGQGAPARHQGETVAEGSTPKGGGGRDRFLDMLRAIALVRVVTYHTFGGAFFSMVFPAIGIMFALAGSLMAASLKRPAGSVLRSRTRRLLLPFWAYSITVLVLFALHGWVPGDQGTGPWYRLLFWFVPLGDPPFPDELGGGIGVQDPTWPIQAGEILWYIRAYFWFMLLSPLLLKIFRAQPLLTFLAPLAMLVILEWGVVPMPDGLTAELYDLGVYGSCWILGFAHHDGYLRRLSLKVVIPVSLAVMALGFWWAFNHQTEDGMDLNAIPIGQALWSLGFCAVLMRISPRWQQFPRPLRFLDGFVTLLNNRAVTVYLWHNLLIALTVPIMEPVYESEAAWELMPRFLETSWPPFILTWLMLAVVLCAVGWVEDIAAKRRPRLWPTGRRERQKALSASL